MPKNSRACRREARWSRSRPPTSTNSPKPCGASAAAALFLVLLIVSSAVLFGGVIWSKFAHMFFKPAAAFQKRMAVADGSMDNLPEPADRTNPADRDRHSMELLKDAPLDMGLGIKREQPHHY